MIVPYVESEISIKSRLGKIDLGGILPGQLIDYAHKTGFELISLSTEEAISCGDLADKTHNDPFGLRVVWK